MRVDTLYDIGEFVYLKTDHEQKQGIITQICIKGRSLVAYEITFGQNPSWHYDFEMTKERDIIKATS